MLLYGELRRSCRIDHFPNMGLIPMDFIDSNNMKLSFFYEKLKFYFFLYFGKTNFHILPRDYFDCFIRFEFGNRFWYFITGQLESRNSKFLVLWPNFQLSHCYTLKFEEAHDVLGQPGRIVATLMKPYFERGHKLFIDNYYSSPGLA